MTAEKIEEIKNTASQYLYKLVYKGFDNSDNFLQYFSGLNETEKMYCAEIFEAIEALYVGKISRDVCAGIYESLKERYGDEHI